ncbi:MAG: hypothetical protein RL650_1749 [Pseudomonadota bacterium]|jgi:hypothetical protein
MMMQEEIEKQAVRNLIQLDAEPTMRPDFQDKMTKVWLDKSMAQKLENQQPRDIQVLAFLSQHWAWGMTLLVSMTLGFWYWHHLHEMEELRQFDVLLEFSMGTL